MAQLTVAQLFRENQEALKLSWLAGEYRIRTNSLGFKDGTTREIPKTSDRHRILIVGDLFAEG